MNYSTNNSSKPGRSRARFLFIAVLCGLLITGALAYFTIFRTSNAASKADLAVAESFTAALLSGDGESSYELLTTRAKQAIGTKENWKQQLSQVKRGATYTRENSRLIDQPEAAYGKGTKPVRISYIVTSEDGHTYDYYVIVTTENNTQKIDEFNSTQR